MSPFVGEVEGVRFTEADFGTGLFGTVGQAVFSLPSIRYFFKQTSSFPLHGMSLL